MTTTDPGNAPLTNARVDRALELALTALVDGPVGDGTPGAGEAQVTLEALRHHWPEVARAVRERIDEQVAAFGRIRAAVEAAEQVQRPTPIGRPLGEDDR